MMSRDEITLGCKETLLHLKRSRKPKRLGTSVLQVNVCLELTEIK